jgi:hypothetical protein
MARICILHYENDQKFIRKMIHSIQQYTILLCNPKTSLKSFDETMEKFVKLMFELIDFSESKPVIFRYNDIKALFDFLNHYTREFFIQQNKNIFKRRIIGLTHMLSLKVATLKRLQDTCPSTNA